MLQMVDKNMTNPLEACTRARNIFPCTCLLALSLASRPESPPLSWLVHSLSTDNVDPNEATLLSAVLNICAEYKGIKCPTL